MPMPVCMLLKLIRFRILRCKNYVAAPEIKGPSRQNYGTEIIQIPGKKHGAEK